MPKTMLKTSQDAPQSIQSQIEGQDTRVLTWAEWQALIHRLEKAAYWEGYKAAKEEWIKEIIRKYGKGSPD